MLINGKANMLGDSFQQKRTIKSPQSNAVGQRYLVNSKGMLLEDSKILSKGSQNYANGMV